MSRRAFTLQLYSSGVQSGAGFEAEAKFLDNLAHIIDAMLDLPERSSTIRHDSTWFNCYVGPRDNKALIVRKRGRNALQWTSVAVKLWCHSVALDWLEMSGSPRIAQDGNRLPRPVEETLTSVGNQPEPINRVV